MLGYLAWAFLTPGMKEELPEYGHERLGREVWEGWRREKGAFGTILCVRGENEEVQTHSAQQTPCAIHKFHFEESKTSRGSAEKKARHNLVITDSIFVLQNSTAKITSMFYPSSAWCETQRAKICPLLPAQLMGGGKEFQEWKSLLPRSPGRRSGAGQQEENVEFWLWRVARSESTEKCLVWEKLW